MPTFFKMVWFITCPFSRVSLVRLFDLTLCVFFFGLPEICDSMRFKLLSFTFDFYYLFLVFLGLWLLFLMGVVGLVENTVCSTKNWRQSQGKFVELIEFSQNIIHPRSKFLVSSSKILSTSSSLSLCLSSPFSSSFVSDFFHRLFLVIPFKCFCSSSMLESIVVLLYRMTNVWLNTESRSLSIRVNANQQEPACEIQRKFGCL